MRPYPLLFEPILKEKVWGGTRLAGLGKDLPPGAPVGESWEIADLDETSPDGGGGGAARSVIRNGEMRGLTLRDAVTALGPNLMDAVRPAPGGAFPLLLKFLDARENLSVQVHPSPEYAASNEGAHLKTESWYVVGAEPGSVIYRGLRPGVTPEAMRAAIEGGGVEDLLVAMPARPGDLHHLPSGTCHALGAGVLVAEAQTPSDTTFRVYDWGRTGRALHVEPALACIDFGGAEPPAPSRSDGSACAELVSTDFYRLFELRRSPGERGAAPTEPGRPEVWTVLEGAARLEPEGGAFDEISLGTGDTCLFPAACAPSVAVFTEPTRVLRVTFPGGA